METFELAGGWCIPGRHRSRIVLTVASVSGELDYESRGRCAQGHGWYAWLPQSEVARVRLGRLAVAGRTG